MFRIFSQQGFQIEFERIVVAVLFGKGSHCSNFVAREYVAAPPGKVFESKDAEVRIWRVTDNKSIIEKVWPRVFQTKLKYNSVGYVDPDMLLTLLAYLRKNAYKFIGGRGD